MLLLLLFALLAGAGTALSPCVLPILPVVLGAGVTGGRRRPLGVVIGLVLSFAFAAVLLAYVIEALGLPNDVQRIVAIVVLAGFGIALLIPPVGDRFEAVLSRVVGAPRLSGGEGFGSGLALGGALGLAYFPCAGPILAGVITVSAAQEFTVARLAVALAYAAGSGLVLYAIMRLGRRLTDRIKPYQGRVQMAVGALMVVVAIAITFDLDQRFQQSLADDFPDVLVNPTGGLEDDDAIRTELAEARGTEPHALAAEAGAAEADAGARLPVVGEAGEFTDTQAWFNTDGEPLSIAELNAEGKTVLIDFWTYTCINCIRTLPYLKAWDEEYRDDGLVIVGVHSPEFPFEKEAGNVEEAIETNGLEYPVVQDNELGTWDSFANQYWPAKYLIDTEGNIRYSHFGEGDYEQTEKAIRSLLAEGGDGGLGPEARAKVETIDPGLRTPETYLGSLRAEGWLNGVPPTGSLASGTSDFGRLGQERLLDRLPTNGFLMQGRWRVRPDGAEALSRARLDLRFEAAGAYLVMGSPGRERRVRVLLDGEPIPARAAGSDVRNGIVRVGEERLYRLVELPEAENHILSLELEDGISGYAFTFR